jgi:hypothetical protein
MVKRTVKTLQGIVAVLIPEEIELGFGYNCRVSEIEGHGPNSASKGCRWNQARVELGTAQRALKGHQKRVLGTSSPKKASLASQPAIFRD